MTVLLNQSRPLVRLTRPLALASALLLLCLPSWALYKVVGPDGQVTYTDRPPVDAKAKPLQTGATGGSSSTPSLDGLPYELQKVVTRYPVVLYSSSNCAPCDSGRQYLLRRGVPFSEKTVNTNDDVKTYKKAIGSDQLPTLKIGSQQLQGYAEGEWTSYLSAAGYPEQSTLPSNYKQPAATPLAPPPTVAPVRESGTPAPSSGGTTPAPSGNAPPGFRF